MEQQDQNMARNTLMGIEVMSGVTKRNFLFLFMISFVCQWVMTTLALIRPAFLKSIIGIPDVQAGTINAILINVALTAGLLFTIYVGALSDRFGRKPLLLIGFLSTGLMYIVYGHTRTIASLVGLESLIAVLILLGVISFLFAFLLLFTWPQIITLSADYSLPKSRGRIMAIQGMMMGISQIIMFVVLGQLPKRIGIMPMFYIGAFFGLLCFILTQFGLVEKMPEKRAQRKTWDDMKELFQEVKKSIELKVSYINILSARADIGILTSFVIVWMVTVCQNYGYTPEQATTSGALPLGLLSVSMVLSMPVFGILVDKWGRVPTVIVSLLVGGVALCLLGLVENPYSKTMWMAIIFCGFAFSGSLGSQTMVADTAPKHLVGTALGGLNTAMVLGGIIFTQIGGVLFDKVGYGMPFIVKGIANVIVALWIFSVRKRIKDLGRKGSEHPAHH